MKVGDPFNPAAVRHDVGALTSRYRDNGLAVGLGPGPLHDLGGPDGRRTSIYRVEEGMRAFFGRTIIRGNAFTHVERIRRQVAWKEGEPFSEEKIADTQQNLSRTGVFRSIDGQAAADQPGEPDAERSTSTLTEARRLSLLYGFGYEYAAGATTNRNDVFGIVGGTYRNLFGRMRSATLELQYAPLSSAATSSPAFSSPTSSTPACR